MNALKKENIEEEYKTSYSFEDDDSEHHDEEESEELWLISYADLMTLLMAFFALLLSFSTFDLEKVEQVKQKAAEQYGGEYDKPHEQLQEDIKQVIVEEDLGEFAQIEKHPLGVVISLQGSVLFNSGSVRFKASTKSVLSKLIGIVKTEANGYNLIIEGHTDDAPISSNLIKSNWELSALRASTLARAFTSVGFDKNRIKVSGYADSKPVVPNRNPAGEPLINNRAKNRRVVLKVLNLGKKNEEPI